VRRRAWPRRAAGALVLLLFAAPGCDPPPPDAERPGADPVPEPTAPAGPVRDTILEASLREAAGGIEGHVGVAVLHFQQNVVASLDGDRAFPLASVYKLPIAYAALQVGGVDPGGSVAMESTDLAPGDNPFEPGAVVTVAALVERSLAHSDNTASDILLRLAGGPEQVTRRTQAIGAHQVRVDRTMREIFANWRGPTGPAGFMEDGRDTGTAEGMVSLLAALHRGHGLSTEARRLLLDAMRAADTGPNRIRAGVPAGTTVAHKTGTLGPLTHDVGIITLPAGRGDVALAVLMAAEAPLAARERAIAATARAVWVHFVEPR
jgi:beta-lactamase class A